MDTTKIGTAMRSIAPVRLKVYDEKSSLYRRDLSPAVAQVKISPDAIIVDVDAGGPRVWIEYRHTEKHGPAWVVVVHADDGDPSARITLPDASSEAIIETEGL